MDILGTVDEQKKLLRATQVAEILSISRAMAYRLIQIGEIRSVQIGAARRVRLEDLTLYIENNLTSAQKRFHN